MFIFIFLMGIIEYHFCLECPEKYRNLSEKHVMCVKLNGTCVETEDIRPMKKLLDYHNMIRNMGPPFNFNLPAAADMLKMEWDEELFEMAKRYALQCPDSPDCQNCFRSDRFPVKQNFAIRRLSAEESFDSMKQIERFKNVILEWAKESINFEIMENGSPRISQNTSRNLINIFQSKANKLGCATSYFKSSSDSYKEVYICNYALSNYLLDRNLYNEDKPCSKCPPHYKCDSKYTQLCAREVENINKEIARSVLKTEFKQDFSECTATINDDCIFVDLCVKVNWRVSSNDKNLIQIELNNVSDYKFTAYLRQQFRKSGCLTFQYKIKPANPLITLGIVAVKAPERNEYSMDRIMVKNEEWNKLSKYAEWEENRFLLVFRVTLKTSTTIMLKDFVFMEGKCPENE